MARLSNLVNGSRDPSTLGLRHRLRFLARDSLLYGGATAFNKALALVTFPLLARHFSVREYGILDYFTVLASLLTVLFVFGQDTAVARFYYEEDDEQQRRQVISEALLFQLLLVATLVPIGWLLVDRLAPRLNPEPESALLLKLVLLQVPWLVLINFSQNILKWTFSRRQFLTVSVGTATMTLAGVVLAVLYFELSIAGVMGVYVGTSVLFGLVGLWFVRDWLVRPRGWRHLRPMLAFAAPYGVVCTVAALIPALERTLVVRYLGPAELGLFAAGAKVALLIVLPVTAFQVAWGPFSLAIYKSADAAATYNTVLKVFSTGILSAVLVLTAASELIIRALAGTRYAGASVVVFGLSLALALESIGWITSIGIGLSKRTYLGLYAYGVFLVVSLVAMLALLPWFGLAGIAWGALVGYAAKTLLESWLAQRAYPLPWAYGGSVRLALLAAAAGLASQAVASVAGLGLGSAAAGVGALGVGSYGWLRVLGPRDRLRIRRNVRSSGMAERA